MELDQALKKVVVIGAAGKMGKGIASLLLQTMAQEELKKLRRTGTGAYRLYLMDMSDQGFPALKNYLRQQLLKEAEKNINALRQAYEDRPQAISNEQIIQIYLDETLNMVHYSIDIGSVKDAHLVFEAIVEDVEAKVNLFRKMVENGNRESYFFTNTSSIPIHVINEKANLRNRIIGFHFYNPPVVQQLLEIIPLSDQETEIGKLASQLAQRLKKTVVYSKDVAGFIGNGYMIREIAYACEKVKELSEDYSLPQAIYMVNRVTQDWLVRPMGVFQLADYVGLDVCHHICETMQSYLQDPTLKIDLIDQMVQKGIYGGQKPDGQQNEGFFCYVKHLMTCIYSLSAKKYIPFTDAPWIITADRLLGELPKGHLPWKTMQKEVHKDELLKIYFDNLFAQQTLGAQLARGFLQHTHQIAHQLVHEDVARSYGDLETVLKNGFYHLSSLQVAMHE